MKKSNMRAFSQMVGGLLLCGSAVGAHAGFLGETVNVEYLFPDIATVFNSNSVNVVVGAGTELTGFPVGDPRTNIDLSDAAIAITYNSAATWTATSFNGLHFFDVLGVIDAITDVSIASTNLAGLDASRISWDADNIWVNWQGLSFTADTVVSFAVQFGAVPEPATLTLFGLGLAGIGAMRRKKLAA